MSVSAALVFWVLVRQPQCWADRALPFEQKAEQLAVVAQAVATASRGVESVAAMLLTIGYHEGRWCSAVGSGQKRGGYGEGYWQLEGSHHGPGARSGLSLEAVTSSAQLAAEQLSRSLQCGPSPAAVLTAYAGRPCWQAVEWFLPRTGSRSCTIDVDCVRQEGWPTLDSRVSGYWWAVSALRRGHSEVEP